MISLCTIKCIAQDNRDKKTFTAYLNNDNIIDSIIVNKATYNVLMKI